MSATLRQFLDAANARNLDVFSNAGLCVVTDLLADHGTDGELGMEGNWTEHESGEETFRPLGQDGHEVSGEPLYSLHLRGWRPTHDAGGEPVMLMPDAITLDEFDAQPAYRAAEWQSEGSSASICRRVRDGAWLRWTGGEITGGWEDITHRVRELAA